MSGDGVAAQPWPNTLFLSYDLRWGCDRRHKVDDDQLPGPSRLIFAEQLGDRASNGRAREASSF